MTPPLPGEAPNAGDIAHVIAPPPLIYLVPLLGTLVIGYWQPWHFLSNGWPSVLGAVAMLLALGLLVPAMRAFRAARTNPKPWKPTKALVFAGPYRFTRNPMYLAFTLMYVGFACWANSLWALFGLAVVLPVMEWGVIRREERYLARKFGDPYLEYCRRVRRWI